MNITIRPARVEDAPGIARVHVDSWRTTYRDIVPDHVLDSLSYEQREQEWTKGLSNRVRNRFRYVAQDEQERIVGFVTGGPLRDGDPSYENELYAIYLLKETQGQGLGRRLMLTFMERLVQEGSNAMLLWVFADNPARRFYEAMGGHYLAAQPMEIGGVTIEEVSYGWRDLKSAFS